MLDLQNQFLVVKESEERLRTPAELKRVWSNQVADAI
jgi:hypothetical protein